MLDISFASAGLIILLPVFLILAALIKLDSPGPVLFIQTRAGLYGKKFKMYKFRSMEVNADGKKGALSTQNRFKSGLMFKLDQDPRVTGVGKFIRKTSLDELPQLINVLKREMSLVGPRPPTLDEVENYKPHHWHRLSVLPGITGLWQVSGRSDITDFEQVVKLDCEYISSWTPLLDIKLLLKTPGAVLSRRGAK